MVLRVLTPFHRRFGIAALASTTILRGSAGLAVWSRLLLLASVALGVDGKALLAGVAHSVLPRSLFHGSCRRSLSDHTTAANSLALWHVFHLSLGGLEGAAAASHSGFVHAGGTIGPSGALLLEVLLADGGLCAIINLAFESASFLILEFLSHFRDGFLTRYSQFALSVVHG